MQKEYFLAENGESSKSFTIEDLAKKNIMADTLVCEKFGNWKKAKEFPELTHLIDWKPDNPLKYYEQKSESTNQNNRYFIISISALLVLTFFMPWFKFIVGINAMEIVFGTIGDQINSKFRFTLLVFPICGILLSYIFLIKKEKIFKVTRLFFVIPLFTLSFVFLFYYSLTYNSQENTFVSITEFFGIGFWLTLIISILLPIAATTIYGNFNSYFGFLLIVFLITMLLLFLLVNYLAAIIAFMGNVVGLIVVVVILILIILLIGRFIKLILKK